MNYLCCQPPTPSLIPNSSETIMKFVSNWHRFACRLFPLALLLILAFALHAQSSKDPYLWLEEIDSKTGPQLGQKPK